MSSLLSPIPKEGLESLDTYKHTGVIVGWLDKEVLDPWWTALSKYLPWWLHPNILTFSGNFCNIISCYLFITHCGGSKSLDCSEAPNWIFLAFAFNTFIYQTFDALDGKQARATGVGSAFGQLWDHGWDAFTWPHFFISCAATLYCPVGTIRFGIIIYALFFAIYFGYAEARHCGGLVWADGTSQSQIMMMIIGVAMFLIPGGNSFMGTKLNDYVSQIPDYVVLADVVGIVVAKDPIVNVFVQIKKIIYSPKRMPGFWREVFWYNLMLNSCFYLYCTNEENLGWLFIMFNFSCGHICNKVTVYDVCRMEFELIEWTSVSVACLAFASFLGLGVETLHFQIVAGWNIFIFLCFAYGSSNQLLNHLNKPFWRVPAPKQSKKLN